eukprot:gene26386-35026_t
MKFSFELKKLCGSVYNNGNVIFSSDGNSLYSPVGNRVTLWDLVKQTTHTLPFETRKDIKLITLSNSGRFLVVIDVEGHSIFFNVPRQIVLFRFNFKQPIQCIKFSPDDASFAVTHRHGCQIWKSPSAVREFSPLILKRAIAGFNDDTVDLTARVYHRVCSRKMATTVLSGHRGPLVGAFYALEKEDANAPKRVYTVARDGGVFTWTFEAVDPTAPAPSKAAARARDDDSSGDEEEEEEEEEEEKEEDKETAPTAAAGSGRRGRWTLTEREFLWDPDTEVSSVSYNSRTDMLVVGFTRGVFGLYEMPGCVNVHRLSVSTHSLDSVCISPTGDWLGVGSSALGQLLVWEWRSETYVLKQQGHLFGMSSVDFSPDGSLIATAGEDGKVKIWNAASGFCFVTFSEHLAPVTGVTFAGRGQGTSVISCSLDGTVQKLSYSDDACARTAELRGVRAQRGGGVRGSDGALPGSSILASGSWDGTLKTWEVGVQEQLCGDHGARLRHGSCVLAGGRSKFTCIYHVATGVLVKKLQLSHNRSLEGIVDELRSDRLVDGVALDEIVIGDADQARRNALPGTNGMFGRASDGSRVTRPEVVTSALKFSPTGRDFAVATSQGLQLFGLDESLLFAPTDLDVTLTPQAVEAAVARQEFSLAVNMALHLGEEKVTRMAVQAVPLEAVELVVRSVDLRRIRELLSFLAAELDVSRHLEFYLRWCWEIIQTHAATMHHSIRALIRAVSRHEKDILRMSDENIFALSFIQAQRMRMRMGMLTQVASAADSESEPAAATEEEEEEEEGRGGREGGPGGVLEEEGDEDEDEGEQGGEREDRKKKKHKKKKQKTIHS